jgi:multiple sugar transport system ATP-binding protein
MYRKDLQVALNSEVVMGVRPEHVSDVQFRDLPENAENTAPATVEVVEPLGSEVYLYLSTGKHSFQARVDARTRVHPNDQINVFFDLQHLHVFDKTTQVSLLKRQNVERPNSR